MDYYISVGLIGISSVLCAFAGLPALKILQLSGYKASGLIAWWKSTHYDNLVRYCALTLISAIAILVFVGCFGAFSYVRYCACLLFIAFDCIFLAATLKNGDAKVVYTGRMKRLLAIDIIICLILGAGVAFAAYFDPFCQTVVAALAFFSPFAAIAANTLALPIEKLINKKYIKSAKNVLNEKQPVVIGITGSFGKTTAKNLLFDMLCKKYTVLATPGSFNTPMGICKTLNNTYNGEQVFIAELGARYKGDIAELCSIVSPKYGIITAVGDMHIQTLGSLEGVADAKYELASALPSDGLLLLNGYNAPCAALIDRGSACKKELVGPDGRVSFGALSVSGAGTKFELTIDGKTYPVTAKLLGAHIPELVCVCARLAIELGVAPEDIVAATESAQPVEHRLQLMESPDPDVTVIDDAYNSNPIGARNALEVLKSFDCAKIIITPGFVELGSIEKECNTALGERIAGVCDYAYFIGSRAEDIKAGAVGAGMDVERIKTFDSRDAAVNALSGMQGARVILFENDLPDNIK